MRFKIFPKKWWPVSSLLLLCLLLCSATQSTAQGSSRDETGDPLITNQQGESKESSDHGDDSGNSSFTTSIREQKSAWIDCYGVKMGWGSVDALPEFECSLNNYWSQDCNVVCNVCGWNSPGCYSAGKAITRTGQKYNTAAKKQLKSGQLGGGRQ